MNRASRWFTALGVPVALALAVGLGGCSGRDGADGLPTEVDVVALGTSNVAGWGVGDDPGSSFDPESAYPGVYARLLAEERGVSTRLHAWYPDQLGNEIRTLPEWNEILSSDEQMRTDLREAEVVILEIGAHTIFAECGLWWGNVDCLTRVCATMPPQYDWLLGEVRSLVDDDAVVMAINQGILPRVGASLWQREDWPEVRAASFDVWWGGIAAAAAEHGAILVDTVTGFNGPDADQDLFDGLLQADGLHFNDAGHLASAQYLLERDGI